MVRSCLAVICLLAVGPGSALASEGFDCGAFLTEFATMSEKSVASVPLVADDPVPVSGDLLSLDEKRAVRDETELFVDGDRHVECHQLMAGLAGETVVMRGSIAGEDFEILALVVVDSVLDGQAERAAIDRRVGEWTDRDFPLPLKVVNTAQSEAKIALAASSFLRGVYLRSAPASDGWAGFAALAPGAATPRLLETLPSQARGAVQAGRAAIAILCYPSKCSEYLQAAAGTAAPSQSAGGEGTASGGGGLRDEASVAAETDLSDTDETPAADGVAARAPDAAPTTEDADQAEAAPEAAAPATPAEPSGGPPPDDAQEASATQSGGADDAAAVVQDGLPRMVLARGRDGTLQPVPLEEWGGLDCLLSALGVTVFDPALECPDTTPETLREGRFALRSTASGAWELFRIEAETIERVDVALPPDQDPLRCQMTLSYESVDGKAVSVALEPGSDAGVFSAALDVQPASTNGYVRLTVTPAVPADCGGAERRIVLDAREPVLRFPLAERPSLSRSLVYVPLINDVRLSRGSFTERERRLLGQAIVNAIGTAHAGAAQSGEGSIWTLDHAEVRALGPNGPRAPMLAVSGRDLRSGARAPWSTDLQEELTEVSGDPISLTPDIVSRAIEEIVEAHPPGRRLTIVLIGNYETGPLGEAVDVCTDGPIFGIVGELRDRLPALEQVAVFPIAEPGPKGRRQASGATPVGFNPALEEFASEMLRCDRNGARAKVFPFAPARWQTPEEVSRRFGVALSDRLLVLLRDLIRNGA